MGTLKNVMDRPMRWIHYWALVMSLCKVITPLDIGPPVTIARCRVNCLQQILTKTDGADMTDDTCQWKNSCRMCWEMCEQLFINSLIGQSICQNTNRCKRGCKVACKFRENIPKVTNDQEFKWSFPEKAFLEEFPATGHLIVSWSRPESLMPSQREVPFVYVLMSRDVHNNGSTWQQELQTISTKVELDDIHLAEVPEFWLLAVNVNGSRVDATIASGYNPIQSVFTVPDAAEVKSWTRSPKLNMTVDFEVNTTLTTIITWDHPENVRAKRMEYELNYFLNDCGIYEDTPPCEIPAQHFARTLFIPGNEKPRVVLDDIIFNALYHFRLEYNSKDRVEVNIKTPPCQNVDRLEFKRCLVVPEEKSWAKSTKLNMTVDFEVNTTLATIITWDHPENIRAKRMEYELNYALSECGIYKDSPPCRIPPQHFTRTFLIPGNEKPRVVLDDLIFNALYHFRLVYNSKDKVEVNIKTPPCQKVEQKDFKRCLVMSESTTMQSHVTDEDNDDESLSWKIQQESMIYDISSDDVILTLNWSVPFDKSLVELYTLSYTVDNMGEFTDAREVNSTVNRATIFVRPNSTYYVVAHAYTKNPNGRLIEYRSEEEMFVTLVTDSVPVVKKPQKLIQRENTWKNMNDIVLTSSCLILAALVALTVLFVYKKRKSFKEIIIPKTTVAKSNSYKSNVGSGKADYSNQLLVMSDEWELDPRQLTFSSPIGQGAFGKVVIGFYKDTKVAIKVVRDSAPLSYKEDLLAEINLMKRIGSHPNIVSMVGACTLCEPIALVMEYIPYGNLQNFLKRCRQEGDFLKRMGHVSEVKYCIVGENGEVDSGYITPADMLSFARQVAMAMEYLAEKKYVHRDLAARNILLDYNKVIKVCDFGLSRDIYNDNLYHKLTSGKLPLKWMAIESLRDRVFTTASDVWSFGILLWEIVTMGGSPYTHIALADLYYVLANGYRMEKPSNCSNELYTLMRQCWLENPADRPTFTGLRIQIEQLLTKDRNYLELDNIDVPLSTSDSSSAPKSENDTVSLITPSRPTLQTTPSRPASQGSNMTSFNSSNGVRTTKSVTINLPEQDVNICMNRASDWLVNGSSHGDSIS